MTFVKAHKHVHTRNCPSSIPRKKHYWEQVYANSLSTDPTEPKELTNTVDHPTHPPHTANGFACTVTLSMHTPSLILPFPSTALASNPSNVAIPAITLPNTVFLPSRCGAGA